MVKEEGQGRVSIKQEADADMAGLGVTAEEARRLIDTVTTTLPQLVTSLDSLAQNSAEAKRTADATYGALSRAVPSIEGTQDSLRALSNAQATATDRQVDALQSMSEQLAALLAAQRGIQASLTAVADRLGENSAKLDEQNRLSRVALYQRAIANVEANSFKFYRDGSTTSMTSALLVRKVLMACLRGTTRIDVGDKAYISKDGPVDAPTASQRQVFIQALQKQLHGLTGVQPRLQGAVDANGELRCYLCTE